MIDDLTEDNVLLYAIKAYDSPNFIMSEFEEDMKRFLYINRLFCRYKNHNELKERLILNHLVILCNIFGPDAVVRLLFFKTQEEYWSSLKTFLLFLSIMRDKVSGINGKDIISSNIQVDMKIVEILRKIK